MEYGAKGNRWMVLILAWICLPSWGQDHVVPLAPQDRVRLDQAFSLEIPWTPILTQQIDSRPVIVGAVLFDGTNNDRLNVPSDERETIVAHIYDRLNGNISLNFLQYYPGVGTQSLRIQGIYDAATGYTLKSGVEHAVDDVISKMVAARGLQPEADVRILVSGFSRGGAAARHFMNVLETRWRSQNHAGSAPRFYALIFDTVATGQRKNLLLQVPVSADIFYHFVSIDERRIFFDPVLDVPRGDESGRIVTIPVPGAHSDVGASYTVGVGSEYQANIDALLSGMGLLRPECFSVKGDARAQGKNDSRWMLEKLLGIGAPNTDESASRDAFYVYADATPRDFLSAWNQRIWSLMLNNQSSIPRCTSRKEKWLPEFKVTRIEKNFEVTSLPPFNLPSARIISEQGSYFLTYTFDGITLSKISVGASLLDKISDGHSVKLSLAVTDSRDGGENFWWFLDDVRAQQIKGTFYENNRSVPHSD